MKQRLTSLGRTSSHLLASAMLRLLQDDGRDAIRFWEETRVRLHAARSVLRLRSPGAPRLRADHGAAPQQAPPDLRDRAERRRRQARRGPRRWLVRRDRRPGEDPRVQPGWARQPLDLLAEP